MEIGIKKISISAMLVLAISASSFAQQDVKKERLNRKPLTSIKLSAEQKSLLEANRQKDKEAREKFEATFTKKQKQLIEQNRIEAKERKEKFMKTLSPEQKAAMKKRNHKFNRKQFDGKKRDSLKIINGAPKKQMPSKKL
jgi:vacuolar-type H+-ATPase subunit H